MWSSFSSAIPNLKRNNHLGEPSNSEFSDDETTPHARTEEGLECQICWESFNIVENVPYVLWCGHTLCKNCLLGLNFASIKLSNQQFQAPFLISCPWCNLLTPRLICEGNLKFPRKNFFLLWMVESLNGERTKSPLSIRGSNNQSVWSPGNPLALGNQASNNIRMGLYAHRLGRLEFNNENGNRTRNNDLILGRPRFTLHKSLDFFIKLTAKSPLIITFIALIIFVFPASAIVLVLYLLITVLLAIPSFLVLYFAYPGLSWLIREIAS